MKISSQAAPTTKWAYPDLVLASFKRYSKCSSTSYSEPNEAHFGQNLIRASSGVDLENTPILPTSLLGVVKRQSAIEIGNTLCLSHENKYFLSFGPVQASQISRL